MIWVAGPGAVVGLLVIASGWATLRTGWLPPLARRHAGRPQLHAAGALVAGASVTGQALFGLGVLPGLPWQERFLGGNAVLLAGLALIVLGQMLPPRRDRVAVL
ncbi:hypothetical protein [Streptomyces sp. NPDC020983]|uniref:hypothetical protein n=1 Tax=Streptomyces sp. NPDC020983 TaxID=3365106 RepID=UPI00379D4CC8